MMNELKSEDLVPLQTEITKPTKGGIQKQEKSLRYRRKKYHFLRLEKSLKKWLMQAKINMLSGKLSLYLLICLISLPAFTNDIYYKLRSQTEASFFTKKRKNLFNYKRIKNGYFINWREKEKFYVRTFIKREDYFEDKLYVKEEKNYSLIEERTLETIDKFTGKFIRKIHKNNLVVKVEKVVSLTQFLEFDSANNIMEDFEFVEDPDLSYYALIGECKAKENLAIRVLSLIEESLKIPTAIPFFIEGHIELKDCEDSEQCRIDRGCLDNRLDADMVCSYGQSNLKDIISSTIAEGVDCLNQPGVNPTVAKVLLANIYHQSTATDKPYNIKCSADQYESPFESYEGMATTPCSKKYPYVNVISPGCHVKNDSLKKIELLDFKRNLFHEMMHTLGYVHGVAPELPYGCGNYCFPSLSSREDPDKMEALRKVCSGNVNQAEEFFNGIINNLDKANNYGIFYTGDLEYAKQEYLWRKKDAMSKVEDYKAMIPPLNTDNDAQYNKYSTAFSLIFTPSIMVNSLMFISKVPEAKADIEIAKKLSAHYFQLTPAHFRKIEKASGLYDTDKQAYIVETTKIIGSLIQHFDSIGKPKDSFNEFMTLSLGKTCQEEYYSLKGQAKEICEGLLPL